MMRHRSSEPSAPEGCTRPELGCTVEAYLEGQLADEKRDEFERHFFECQACLAAIQLRQDLAEIIGSSTQRAPRTSKARTARTLGGFPWWGWAMGGALAVGLATLLVLVPRPAPPGEGGPIAIHLEGTFRQHEPTPTAPADRDLVLVLTVPVPATPVAYDIEIARDTGEVVFAASDVRPAGPSEVRVPIPRGELSPGPYRVKLLEKGPEEPLVLHFDFEIESETAR